MSLANRQSNLQKAIENQRDKLMSMIVEEFMRSTHNEETIAYTLFFLENELLNHIDILSDTEEHPDFTLIVHSMEGNYNQLAQIYLGFDNYHYRIDIAELDDWKGYCQCIATDKGYNPKYRCCGVDCDYSYPVIEFFKVMEEGKVYYKGLERDIWQCQEDFIEKYLK